MAVIKEKPSHRSRTTRNAATAIIQVVFSSITLVILYRYLLDTIGLKNVGVWSIVMATGTVSRISEMGLAGGAVKFVAKHRAQRKPQSAATAVETAVIAVAASLLVTLLVLYPVFRFVIVKVVEANSLELSLMLLPYALVATFLVGLSNVFMSSLDGCERTDLRQALLILGSLLYLGFAFLFVPKYGLKGLAYMQIGQAVILLPLSWITLRRQLPELSLFPHRWSKERFLEMWSYGVNFQIISVASMLFDPTTKALLSNFGGLVALGYYEVVSRMVIQLRSLLVSANQVVVPVIARLEETSREQVQAVYGESHDYMIYLSFPLFSAITAFSPIISELWIGYYEHMFVIFTLVLATGWLINSLSAPAYFAYMGSGRLRWNTVGHLVVGGVNLLAGFIGGYQFGSYGVVVGWCFAILIGNSGIVIAYHVENRLGFGAIASRDSLILAIGCVSASVLCISTYYSFPTYPSVTAKLLVMMIVFIVPVLWLLWRHPVRAKLQTQLAQVSG